MPESLFSIRGLSKRFPSGYEALSKVNLEISVGSTLVIAGSNGSGKTLLMRLLVDLVEPSEGTILYRGTDIRKDPKKVRREVGLVFQDADAQIVGETVEEDVAFGPGNLGLPKDAAERAVEEALRAMELLDKRSRSPRRLSGGEKRRLAVAGVLAMGSSAIIMDEPFANLDWPGVVQVLKLIRTLKASGKTVIILTHELEKVLAEADRLVILDRGTVRDDGLPREVLDRGVAAYGIRDPRVHYRDIEDCTWLS